jgi:hypothetical protein
MIRLPRAWSDISTTAKCPRAVTVTIELPMTPDKLL